MKKIIATLTLTLIAITATYAQPSGGQGGQREAGGKPPQEAISACKNKDEGTSCSFKSPRGDSAEGTCKTDGEYLACMPSNRR